MDAKTYDLLNHIPENADYAVTAGDIDPEDLPRARIDAVQDLLRYTRDREEYFFAAKLLTSWGIREGLIALENCMEKPSSIEGIYSHRLHGYDDTYAQIVLAVTRYFSNVADLGKVEEARGDIYPLLSRVIESASGNAFEISRIYDFAESENFLEYVPLIKKHLVSIIDSPEIQGWKTYDALKFLEKFDPRFVASLLEARGKTIEDFNPSVRVQ